MLQAVFSIFLSTVLLIEAFSVPITGSENKDEESDDLPNCSETVCHCLYPSKLDCAAYYVCDNGTPLRYSCSPGLLFNEKTHSCDYNDNVYCKNATDTSTLVYSTHEEGKDKNSTAAIVVPSTDPGNTRKTESTTFRNTTLAEMEMTSQEILTTESPIDEDVPSSPLPIISTAEEINETSSETTEMTNNTEHSETPTGKEISGTIDETTVTVKEDESTDKEDSKISITEETTEIINKVTYTETGVSNTSIDEETSETTNITNIATSTEMENTKTSIFEEISETINEITFTGTEDSNISTPRNTSETNTEVTEITIEDTSTTKKTSVIINETTEITNEVTSTDTENLNTDISEEDSKPSTAEETIYETTETTNKVTYTEIGVSNTSTDEEASETTYETTKVTNVATSTEIENTKTSIFKEISEITYENTNEITFTGTGDSKTSTSSNTNETVSETPEIPNEDISTTKETSVIVNETTEITNEVTFTDNENSKTDISEEPLETAVEDKFTFTESTKYYEISTETLKEKDSTSNSIPSIVTKQKFSTEPYTEVSNDTTTSYGTDFTEFSDVPTETTSVQLSTSESDSSEETLISSTQSPSLQNITTQKTTPIATSSIVDPENKIYSRETTINKDITTDSLVTGSLSSDETFTIVTKEELHNFTCPSRFGLFPHPENCTQFYQCSHWIPYLLKCPPSLHFNPVLQVCDYPYEAGCGNTTSTSTQVYSTNEGLTDKYSTSTLFSSTKSRTTQTVPYTTIDESTITEIEVTSNEYTSSEKEISSSYTEIEENRSSSTTAQTIHDEEPSTTFSPVTSTASEAVTLTSEATDTTYTRYFETTTEAFSEENTKQNVSLTTIEKVDFTTKPNTVTSNDDMITEEITLTEGISTEFSKEPNKTTVLWVTSTSESVTNGTLLSSTQSSPFQNTTLQMTTEISTSRVPDYENTTNNRDTTVNIVTSTQNFTTDSRSSDETFSKTTEEISHDFKCPSQFGLFPHPENCTQFYQCSNWIAYRMMCPSNLHFNSVLQVCDWAYEAGCENKSTVSTTEDFTQEDLTSKGAISTSIKTSTDAVNTTNIFTTSMKESTPNEIEVNSSEGTFQTPTTLLYTDNDNTTSSFSMTGTFEKQTTSYPPITSTTKEILRTASEEREITIDIETTAPDNITDVVHTKYFETTTELISKENSIIDSTLSTSTSPDTVTTNGNVTDNETEVSTAGFSTEPTKNEKITDTVYTADFETTTEQTSKEETTTNSTLIHSTARSTSHEPEPLSTKNIRTTYETTFTEDLKTTTEFLTKEDSSTNSNLITNTIITSTEPDDITTKDIATLFDTTLTEDSKTDFSRIQFETTETKLATSEPASMETTLISSTQSLLPNATVQTTAMTTSNTEDIVNVTYNRDTTTDNFVTSRTTSNETFMTTTENIRRNFTCPTRFGLFPDPDNCTQFYECSQWIVYHMKCPSNLHFNPVLQVCDWPYEAGCENGSATETSVSFSKDANSTIEDTKINVTIPTNFTSFLPSTAVQTSISTNTTSTEAISPETATSTAETNESINFNNSTTKYETPQEPTTQQKLSTFFKTTQLFTDENTERTEHDITETLKTRSPNDPLTNVSSKVTDTSSSTVGIFSTTTDSRTDNKSETAISPTETSLIEEISKESSSPQSEFKCPARFGLFSDTNDCNKFYECYQWISSHISCPSNLHFNPTLKVCDWPYEAGCDVSSTTMKNMEE